MEKQLKYVLDENLTAKEDDLCDRVINARELYFLNGIRQIAVEDGELLKLAIKDGYTIITQDRKLIVKANRKDVDIVFASGRRGNKWFFISKQLNINNKGDLKKLIQPEIYSQTDCIVPFFAKK